MDKLWLLACNSFEEALRRRVIYLLVFIGLIVGINALYQWIYMGMAVSAGELEMVADMKGQFVLSLFGLVDFFAGVLAVFLGSVALSSEVKNRTIVPVLSRPVGRVSFFFAKWLGILGFLALFCGAAVAAGVLLAIYWQLQPTPVFFLGIVQMYLGVGLLLSVSFALSSSVHPVLAGGFAFVLILLPVLTADLAGHPNLALSLFATAARYAAPAGLEESLLEDGLVKGLLNPDYALYVSVLAENALYCFAAVLAGALAFSRREVALK
jgi:ABC-type transport system involved in multi-copper enzyme maturation permease subunit